VDFSDILRILRVGGVQVRRTSWLAAQSARRAVWLHPGGPLPDGGKLLPHLVVRTVEGDVAQYQPSQEDLLACDWERV
jgi:hypothetical protein